MDFSRLKKGEKKIVRVGDGFQQKRRANKVAIFVGNLFTA